MGTLWGGRWLYVSNTVEFQNRAMICDGHILEQDGCISMGENQPPISTT